MCDNAGAIVMVSLIKKGVGVIFDKVILRVKSLILGMSKGVW